jgi:transposase
MKQEFFKSIKNASEGLIVSIDESGFDARPKTVYGYGKPGQQVILKAPYCKDRKRHTLTLSIASDGQKYYTIQTKTMTSETFANYIRGLPFPEGTRLILDNASIHKTKEVRDVLEAKGYVALMTPTYSPECNPVELAFGMLKNKYYRDRYKHGFHPSSCIERCIEGLGPKNIKAFFATIL